MDAERLDAAITSATRHLQDPRHTTPPAFLVMDSFRRRFGMEEFAGLLPRYDQAIEYGIAHQAELSPTSELHPSFLRTFRRLITDHKLDTQGHDTWEQFASNPASSGELNALTIPALYCDQIPLPRSYEATLRTALETGGYQLTHAAGALVWLDENGCTAPVDPGFRELAAEAMAELPDGDERVTDLELEATAFLLYMGRPDLMRREFVEPMLASQREDGGWSADSAEPTYESNWHSTVYGLWALLELREPGVKRGPWIPPAD